jgi:ribose transport system permease protein
VGGSFSPLERIVRIAIVLVVVAPIVVGLGLAAVAQRFPGVAIEQILIYALLAAGMSLVMTVEEADLSIGGTATLAMMLAAKMITGDVPALVAVGAALVVGTLVGLLNGVFIGLFRIPFYFVTLLMFGATSGLGYFLIDPTGMLLQGQPFAGSILILIVFNLLVYLLGMAALLLLARSTSLGRLRSLNARSEADGKPNGRALAFYKIAAYTVSGLLAAGAGLAFLNLLRIAQPGVFGDLTTAIIAATLIGGATLWKGSTQLVGAFLGTVTIVLIRVAITLMGISGSGQLTLVVWSALALGTAILWGIASWVLDRIFGKREQKPSPNASDLPTADTPPSASPNAAAKS